MVGWDQRWTRASLGAIADCLGLIPKDGPETYHHNFDLPRRDGSPASVLPEVKFVWEHLFLCEKKFMASLTRKQTHRIS